MKVATNNLKRSPQRYSIPQSRANKFKIVKLFMLQVAILLAGLVHISAIDFPYDPFFTSGIQQVISYNQLYLFKHPYVNAGVARQ